MRPAPRLPSRRPRSGGRSTHAGRRLVRLLAALLAAAAPAAPADLIFFDESAGPGGVRLFQQPVTNVPLDVVFQPTSAEGGGVYGFSEARFVVTGDLRFETDGFVCLVTSCLHYPLPFVTGQEIVVTGGEDLLGEFTDTSDVMTISVTGTNGLILMMEAEYVDATGMDQAPGAIRIADIYPIGVVPEPGTALGLLVGSLGAAGLARRRRPSTTARASSRSGGGPAWRAPRER